jgi:rare lipoprotein A
MNAMTAAHKTMPLPSYALVRNPANGREVVVKVNDRGPFIKGRVIDLSRAAARKLRIAGVGAVEVRRLTHAEIKTGSWKLPVQRVAGAPPP